MRILSHLMLHENSKTTDPNEISFLLNKYKSYAEDIDWEMNSISIYHDLVDISKVYEEASEKKIGIYERKEVIYTKEEIDSASLLFIGSSTASTDEYKEGLDVFFSAKCPVCKVHIFQHSDLKIKKNAGKKDFFETWEFEFCVSPRLKEILEQEQVTGISFRPVYTDKIDEPVAFQLIPTNVLPEFHPMTELETSVGVGGNGITCDTCGFVSYTIKHGHACYYSKEAIESGLDFNHSNEYFGISLWPRPARIVSQRVRQIFLKHKIKGVRFEPIFVVDEN